ncbi:DUF167 domain-containing protein [Desulfosarcina ovata]|uniref:UPF0235 protein DSCOOX_52220 n=1 Tax=Desulfosarcina ovata subsp. ovata TaxID=2752305 RepID=A0A5K8AH82_9BACT|nr:DUF167 domain-containing protein [Desulfosarcina ovata]BBO92042.1 UPF0235 protein [Desulfosarcina ovata subsp. ovata]
MTFIIQEKPDGLIFKIRVQPRSSKNRIAGLHGDALKLNITAPPVDNAANKACSAFLASLLPVPKSAVQIVSGHTGRNKQVLIGCPECSPERETIRKLIRSWVDG